MKFKLKTVLVVFFITFISNLNAQSESALFKILKAKDHLLFEVGFNQCNLDVMEKLVANDIEFYHDKDGITKSKKKFIISIKDNLCTSGKNIIKRVLDESSLQVFPLYQGEKLYGAIQNGTHSFGQTKASYSHLWLLEKQDWKLSRVLSYNHHKDPVSSKKKYLSLSINNLTKYVGVYEFSSEFVLTVSIKGGQLYGGSQGQDVKINCYEKNKFIDEEQTHDLEFLINEKGTVSGLNMKGDGMQMTAKKTK